MLLDIFPLHYTQKYIYNNSSIFFAEEKYLVGCYLATYNILYERYFFFKKAIKLIPLTII